MKRYMYLFIITALILTSFVVHGQTNQQIPGDINGNGVVNRNDLLLLSESHGVNSNDLSYDNAMDLNGDGVIDLNDSEILMQQIGPLTLHGFYPKEIFKSNQMNQKHLIKYFDDISFAFADVKFDSLSAENYGIKISKAALTEEHIDALKQAKENHIPIRLNILSTMNALKNILPYQEKRDYLIDSILRLLDEEIIDGQLYWDGLVIDFEELRDTQISAGTGVAEKVAYDGKYMSELYVTFLKDLKERIHIQDSSKDLYIAVPYSPYYDGYNYRELGAVADKIILMAHDYEPKGNIKKSDVLLYLKNPNLVNSLAPINRVEKAIQALTDKETGVEDPQKILLQISFGTAQWKFNNVKSQEDWSNIVGETQGVHTTPSYSQIHSRMTRDVDRGIPNYIEVLGSPYISYYNSEDQSFNFILYEDSRSITEKIIKAKEAGIGGISLWSLGRIPEYPDMTDNGELFLNAWTQIIDTIGLKYIKE
ncbi:glycosyl hydrolase family 18 protein [Geosporobacter ferrireducens]|uniref:Chitinase II/V-like catalytic domain-containing protein n=1 Tax=Geosporobacter ferrireducens TaxID=1424294 RepID=A0A1D8GIL9_9FIRM|nr:glycosyl hydrolase family 18 protein [Geosporobacter ferrireducens]AOT70741.1 hypothetical protein Gferi_14845 [Geosporobacter ferrireducens]